jgi:hypothetical protein
MNQVRVHTELALRIGQRILYNSMLEQKRVLENIDILRSIKKLSKSTYIDEQLCKSPAPKPE